MDMDDIFEVQEAVAKTAGDDLAGALRWNDTPIELKDLLGATIEHELTGERNGVDWHWIVKLTDGWAYIHGGCDFTGWDCQSSADAHRAASLDEAIALCPEDVRATMEEMRASGEKARPNTITGWR